MTERDFASDLFQLLMRGLIEFEDASYGDYEMLPRVGLTEAGAAAIAKDDDVEHGPPR